LVAGPFRFEPGKDLHPLSASGAFELISDKAVPALHFGPESGAILRARRDLSRFEDTP